MASLRAFVFMLRDQVDSFNPNAAQICKEKMISRSLVSIIFLLLRLLIKIRSKHDLENPDR
jgi:hypothetical protein